MGPFKKYVNCVMAFLTSFNFVTKYYSITSPVLFLKFSKKL